ncbi:MAG: cytochrome c biogenesis protein [Myxococcota bacterium]
MDPELLWTAIAGYAVAAVLAARALARGEAPGRAFAGVFAASLAVHVVSVGVRWVRLGHGPFITFHETLSSNVLSLLGLYGLVWWAVPVVRAATAFAFPVPLLMAAWMVGSDPSPGHFPPTFATPLLYAHVLTGKVFLASFLVALSLGHVLVLRRFGVGLATLPPDGVLAGVMHRFLGVAFVFDTAMLVVGALWAQDAWGRWWDWDPLETWSFLTWISLGTSLHLRTAAPGRPALQAAVAGLAFVVAFLTFFGIPFVSTAQHQGAI